MTMLLEKPVRPLPARKSVSIAEAQSLLLRGTAPDHLCVEGSLSLVDWKTLTHLPAGLTVNSLNLSGCVHLQELPEGLQVRRLNLTGCTGLQSLPSGLRCNELI